MNRAQGTVDRAQTTDAVLMVRPGAFGVNPETLGSNAFQDPQLAAQTADLAVAAGREFDALVEALTAAGVEVLTYDPPKHPPAPDAVFPNNWFSTHADGTVVLYPMQAKSRRIERRLELLDALRDDGGFRITRLVDLSHHEAAGVFLEGTGSLVLDRPRHVAYACLSARTDRKALESWAAELGYDVVAFHASDESGRPIYHTNVMMCLGTASAVVCLDAVGDAGERAALRASLEVSGRSLVTLSLAQLREFAGNMLELRTRDGSAVIAMSQRAAAALSGEQRSALERHARIVASPIPTIETAGGGSVRCMLAEVFLPREVRNV